MANLNKKSGLQALFIVFGLAFNVWGIMTLLQTIGVNTGLAYIDAIPNLIARYVVVVITMAIGIMTLSAVAGTFKGKVRDISSVVVCTYSTILTIPLFLTFILCIPIACGATLPGFIDEMVRDICLSFQDIFGTGALQYIIYVLGTIMGAVFLAVPIISTYCTVKEIDIIKLIKDKLKK